MLYSIVFQPWSSGRVRLTCDAVSCVRHAYGYVDVFNDLGINTDATMYYRVSMEPSILKKASDDGM